MSVAHGIQKILNLILRGFIEFFPSQLGNFR